MDRERVNRPFGWIAEVLVENSAKVSPREIRDLLMMFDAGADAERVE
jgi:hypothetical protein